MDPRIWVVIGGLGSVAALQGPLGEANHARRRNDFRYTPKPGVVRVIAGAHRSTMADLLWLKALPDMSREFEDKQLKERWLDASLQVVTDLEPDWRTPYQYGSTYLVLLDRKARKAIALLERGLARKPNDSALLRDIGMLYFEHLKDHDKAYEYLSRAAEQPDCDVLTLAMVQAWQVKNGKDAIALSYWERLLDYPNPGVQQTAKLHYETTKLQIVTRAFREFEEEHGRPPATKEEVLVDPYVQPSLAELLAASFEFGEDGKPIFAKQAELRFDASRRGAEDLARRFREAHGRWPTLDELRDHKMKALPRAPEGKAWSFSEGKLELVPAK